MERKSAELPDLFGEHLQSYKTYLQRTTLRATRPIWRGNHAEQLDIFGDVNMQSYKTYLEKKTVIATRPIWRRKPTELPDLFGDENQQLSDLFGD